MKKAERDFKMEESEQEIWGKLDGKLDELFERWAEKITKVLEQEISEEKFVLKEEMTTGMEMQDVLEAAVSEKDGRNFGLSEQKTELEVENPELLLQFKRNLSDLQIYIYLNDWEIYTGKTYIMDFWIFKQDQLLTIIVIRSKTQNGGAQKEAGSLFLPGIRRRNVIARLKKGMG